MAKLHELMAVEADLSKTATANTVEVKKVNADQALIDAILG